MNNKCSNSEFRVNDFVWDDRSSVSIVLALAPSSTRYIFLCIVLIQKRNLGFKSHPCVDGDLKLVSYAHQWLVGRELSRPVLGKFWVAIEL